MIADDTTAHLSYVETRRAFRWHIPEFFNAAIDSLDRQCRPGADPDRTALITTLQDGKTAHFSYGELKRLSDLMASALVSLLVEPGSSVATFLPQGLELSVTTLATLKAGGIIAPISTDWSPSSLIKAIQAAQPRVIITDQKALNRARLIAEACSPAPSIICVNSPHAEISDFWTTVYAAPIKDVHVATRADDPAFLIFSKGRTENPKAIVHAHRSVLGNLPALKMVMEGIPRSGDALWCSAAPYEFTGLIGALFTPWIFGIPVLAMDAPKTMQDVETCFEKISEFGIRLLLLTPAALQLLKLYSDPRDQFSFSIRAAASLGGNQPEGAAEWCLRALGIPLEKLYGEAETGLIAATHTHWFTNQGEKHLGRAAPGANINIVDNDGLSVALGGIGHLALPQKHPGICLHSLGPHQETSHWARRKYVGNWFLTDDIASLDEENTLTFQAKSDDILPHDQSGYLPDDVEVILNKHHMVARSAVLKHEKTPGSLESIAVICPKENFAMGDAAAESMLAHDIVESARKSLAPYALPEHIVFLKAIPLTDEGRAHRAVLREAIRHSNIINVI